eukprot:TRINITY_DN5320_c0_g1_i2.p1 TRINITY_DN5320_c0_g1~~TRINITY_DN5320_c0_g1_i2.p1  ORF type:complete len:236 (+),score=49.67 TRINITY_DN5320_c0_g1_i2:60-767(+)
MDCCASIAKYLIFFINFLFALVGLLLIGLGAYIQLSAKEYLDFLSDNYLNTPIFIIIVGVVIFVVAFFGCCGAWNESACMIYTYAFFLVVILIAQIGAGIAAFVLKGELKGVIKNKMIDGMDNYGVEGYEGVTNAWDVIQGDLDCCGVSNYTDWKNHGKPLPDSCCKVDKKGCASEPGWEDNINTNGCFSKFEDTFVGNLGIVGGIAVGIAFVELLAVIISCCVGNNIRKESAYV